MYYRTDPLYLPASDFRTLFANLGPSLGVWRGAEIAAMREALFADGARPGDLLNGSAGPVLDLGCGNGLISSYLLPRISIGLDLDRPALDQCARRGLYEQLLDSPIEQAHLPDGCLGTIISNSVLEHIECIDDVLEAAGRALRPGGRLIFTSPTEAFSEHLALPWRRYVDGRNQHFIHLNLWPVERWQRHLGRAGLRIETVRPYMRLGWVRAWDWAELSQMLYLGKTRVVGWLWKHLTPRQMEAVARRAARLDLSACPPGGGRLIVARRAR